MAKQKPTRTHASADRAGVWIAVLAAIVLIAAGAFYLLRKPATAPKPSTVTNPATTPATPFTPRHIYSETADPKADIAAGLAKAKREHKRVLIDFGGDWCGDCQVLDMYFHQQPNWDLLQKNFVLVHVWIGQMDRNIDVAAKYGVPISKGVPALAVLSGDGKVLFSQSTGQFSRMRHMESKSVTDFLEEWKA